MKILVVAPAWVGDMVMAHTLVSILAQQGAAVYLVAPPATEPLARRMPGVQGSWVLHVGHGELGLKTRRALAHELKAESFDQAIVLPNSRVQFGSSPLCLCCSIRSWMMCLADLFPRSINP